jgi:hypothetical protein
MSDRVVRLVLLVVRRVVLVLVPGSNEVNDLGSRNLDGSGISLSVKASLVVVFPLSIVVTSLVSEA